jgi:hypothetical protein
MRHSLTDLTICITPPGDEPALRRVAALDSRPLLEPGPHLVPEYDETPVAVLSRKSSVTGRCDDPQAPGGWTNQTRRRL